MAAEPDESGWRVRIGFGLVQDAPFSAERRAVVEREAEREAEQERRRAAFAAEHQTDAEIERIAELRRQGYEPRTRAQLFEQVSRAMDRQDKIDAKNEERTRAAREDADGERHAQRVAQLEADLATERRAHSRTSSQYHAAVDGWGRERQRNQSSEHGYQQPRNYTRSGPPGGILEIGRAHV